MNIMTKRGSQDNVVTYEHYCDTKADLDNIPQDKITLGSVAIVLKDEGNEMGIYIANSNKEWISFSNGGGGSNMSDISLSNLLDISLANPTDGQTLVYNGESGKWENKTVTNEGGGSNPGYKIIKIIRSIDAGDTSYALYNLSDWDEIVGALDSGTYVMLWGVTNGNLLAEGPLFNYSGRMYSNNGETTELYFSGNANLSSGFTVLRIIKGRITIQTF